MSSIRVLHLVVAVWSACAALAAAEKPRVLVTSDGEIDDEQPTFAPNLFPVFKPPYPFSMDKVEDVKRLVTDPSSGAGNRPKKS